MVFIPGMYLVVSDLLNETCTWVDVVLLVYIILAIFAVRFIEMIECEDLFNNN